MGVTWKYRPDIDGLRALAVLSVVIFHAFPSSLKGGYIGVDIFFVISGYLISSIIFTKISVGKMDFKDFYLRRMKRIFPILILVTISTLFLGWCLLLRDEFRDLGKHVAGSSLFISNFVLWNESGYFDKSTDFKPLLHLWSLAIEEQFYILWPLLIFLFSKLKNGVFTALLFMLIASFSYNIFNISSDPVGTFYSPLSRFWEICAGSLLAFTQHRQLYREDRCSQLQWDIIAYCGLVLICFALISLDEDILYPGFWALCPVVGTVLLIAAGSKAQINAFFFSSKPMVKIGLLSFSFYLWHWPLLAFARIVEGDKLPKLTGISIVLTALILSWASYRFVERPLRFSTKKIVVPLLIGLIVFCGLLGFGIFTTNILGTTLMSDVLNPHVVNAKMDWTFPSGLSKVRLEHRKMSVYYNKFPAEVVFFGDSHMEQYSPHVSRFVKENKAKNVVFYTSAGCLPIPNVYEDLHPYCRNFVEDFLSFIASNPTIKHIVIGACWNCYFLDEIDPVTGKYNYHYLAENKRHDFRGGDGKQRSLLEFKKLVRQLAERFSVTLVFDNPSDLRFDPHLMMPEGMTRKQITFSTRKKSAGVLNEKFERPSNQVILEKEMADLLKDLPVQAITTGHLICPGNECSPLDHLQRPIYKDKSHMRSSFVAEKINIFNKILMN